MYLSPVEQIIRQAMRDGLFDDLPGFGESLKFIYEENPNVPEESKMAYKIMKDHEVVPDWIQLKHELEEREVILERDTMQSHRAFKRMLQQAEQVGDLGKRRRILDQWANVETTLEEAIAQYNKRVLTYNLKVPRGIPHKPYLDLQRFLKRSNEEQAK
ncbi:MAG: DUF1992 domain-containing protein [Phototrophicaceae bacterium]